MSGGRFARLLALVLGFSLLFGLSRFLVERARPVFHIPRLIQRSTVAFDLSRSPDAVLLAMAVAPNGAVGMLDAKSGVAQVFSATGTFLFQTPSEMPGGGKLQHPQAITFGDGGELYLADTGNQRVVQFVPDGSMRVLGQPGIFNGQFVLPVALTVCEGSLCVLDAALCRISRFAADGSFLGKAGARGGGPGMFRVPTHIARDEDAGLAVLDSRASTLSRFDPALGFQSQRRISASDANFPADRVAFAGDGLTFFLSRKRQEIAVFYQQTAVDLLTPATLGTRAAVWTDIAGQGNSLYLLDGKGRSVSRFEIAD